MIKTIIFDLDGTLLPMDQEIFTKAYFKRLAERLLPYGYDPKKLVDAVWTGTAAMVKNDGSSTNEEAFWQAFSGIFGQKVIDDKPIFDNYYQTDFQKVAADCGNNPEAAKLVQKLKELGYRLILATNPIFPAVATESRIRWAGLEPSDFEYYTTYENSNHCKPNPDYYKDILEKCVLKPEECLMVGNDVEEDMIAENVGMKVFLLTDCLINSRNRDISGYPNGGFTELERFIYQFENKI